jgi:drug/metabolite transporter (DMT)-like permease|tara:strand:- start:55 stop:978 length:924 start_codon:yes stop_codon:yes gene_type:complete
LRNLLKSDGLLLLAAIIWGFAFVAQRIGMVHIGPFLFNGFRFALGCLVLLPLVLKKGLRPIHPAKKSVSLGIKTTISAGALAGFVLFSGASFQQVGLVYTTAGNAGFITGLYVVIVPLLALFWRTQTSFGTWVGASLAAAGLYLLSVTEHLTISFGDLLEIIGAFFWAGHVLIIGGLSSKIDSLQLAFFQYAICAILSLITAFFFETFTLYGLSRAAVPILYGGVLSVGVGYTLQVVGQRNAHPAHAAVFLSLEAVFAAVGGRIVLGEILTVREAFGCGLMLSGMLFSQLWGLLLKNPAASIERDLR